MRRSFPYVLLAVKAGLLLWGVFGLWEYIDPAAGFGLQHPNFPRATQLLHWLLLLLTGAIFVLGFTMRWRLTPFATIAMYVALATLCFVETLDFGAFGGGIRSYFIMAGEYALYIALSIYLLRSRQIGERFRRRAAHERPRRTPEGGPQCQRISLSNTSSPTQPDSTNTGKKWAP